jgi:hypothetical protein
MPVPLVAGEVLGSATANPHRLMGRIVILRGINDDDVTTNLPVKTA